MPYVSLEDSSFGIYLAGLQKILPGILEVCIAAAEPVSKAQVFTRFQLESIAQALATLQQVLVLFSQGKKPGTLDSLALIRSYMTGDIGALSVKLPKIFTNPRVAFFKKLLTNFEISLPKNTTLLTINDDNQALFRSLLKEQYSAKALLIIKDEINHPDFAAKSWLAELADFIDHYDFLHCSEDGLTPATLTRTMKEFTEQCQTHCLSNRTLYQFPVYHSAGFDFAWQMLELSATLPERLDDFIGFLNPEVLKSGFFSKALPKLFSLLNRFSHLVCPEDNSSFCFMVDDTKIDLGHYYRLFRHEFTQYLSVVLQDYINANAETDHVKSVLGKLSLVNHFIFKVQQEKVELKERMVKLLNEESSLQHYTHAIVETEAMIQRKTAYFTRPFIELITCYPDLLHYASDQMSASDFYLPPYILWSGYSEKTNLVVVAEQLMLHDSELESLLELIKQKKIQIQIEIKRRPAENPEELETLLTEKRNELSLRQSEQNKLAQDRTRLHSRIRTLSDDNTERWSLLTEAQKNVLKSFIPRAGYSNFFSASRAASSNQPDFEPRKFYSEEQIQMLLEPINRKIKEYQRAIEALQTSTTNADANDKRLDFLTQVKSCFANHPNKLPLDELDRICHIMWLPGLAWWNRGRGIKELLTCLDSSTDFVKPSDEDSAAIELLVDEAIKSAQSLKDRMASLSLLEKEMSGLSEVKDFIETRIMPVVDKLSRAKLKLNRVEMDFLYCVEQCEQLKDAIEDIDHEISMYGLSRYFELSESISMSPSEPRPVHCN